MKVGILYPRSTVYPGMMLDFVDGIRIYLKKQGLEGKVQLVTESVGFAGSEKEVYEKAEKLLILENADLLVAYIDEKVTGLLEPLMMSSGKLLLIVNPGANYPENWIPQPNIIHLTLQDAFLCWLSGKMAGSGKEKNGLMASSFYDCGYLHVATMVNGFNQSGGNIVYNYINKQKNWNEFRISELTDYLETNPATRNLLCIFDSPPASLFYRELNQYAKAGQLQLFVSPMMLQPQALENSGSGFQFDIEGCLPWSSSDEKTANAEFIDYYHQQTKRQPDIFALLGWEVGMVIEKILLADIDFNLGEKITAALVGSTLDGPRGEMKLDTRTNYYCTPFVKCRIPKNSANIEMKPEAFPLQGWESFVQENTENAGSGWINTYLCY